MPKRLLRRCAGAALALALAATRLTGHPISLTQAVARIDNGQVEVEMSVLLEDLVFFQGLESDRDNLLPVAAIQEAAAAYEAPILRDFHILAAAGQMLTGAVQSLRLPELPPAGVPRGDAMKYRFVYDLRYPLRSPPQLLTFHQQFGGPGSPLPAVLNLSVEVDGKSIGEETALPRDLAYTVRLDAVTAGATTGKQRGETTDQSLGLDSYGAVYSFVYVEESELRHEILVPILTLMDWLPLESADPMILTVAEQTAAAEKIGRFFAAANPLELDGILVKPIVQRVDFFGVDFADFAKRAEPRPVSMINARVGVILAYSATGRVDRLALKWSLFGRYLHSVRTAVFIGEEGHAVEFDRRRRIWHWVRPASAAAAPATAVAHGDIETTFPALLRNIYRAFDYPRESDIYDALALSIDGDLLAEVYLKIRRSLAVAEQGGAVSRVRSVDLTDCRVIDAGRREQQLHAAWTVAGTVEHWGHIHSRRRAYEADFTVVVRPDETIRIAAMKVLSEKRLGDRLQLRSFPAAAP